ncbi:MAG: hypothetical protein Q8943_17400 [Bacteroidota bacterium]|nr:hypothetical protein [Bacteroidota bacterium]
MPLEKDVLDACVAKYSEYRGNGMKPSEIWAEVKKDPLKLKNDEVDEIVDAIFAMPAGEIKQPAKDGEEMVEFSDEPSDDEPKNMDFEEWRVESIKEPVKDQTGKTVKWNIVGFTRLKCLRSKVRTSPRFAREMNSQSQNTNLRLYPLKKK